MKLQRIWRVIGAALAISILLIVSLGNGILAKSVGQGKGNSLSVLADTVTGGSCVQSYIFHPGDRIVWKIRVFDGHGNALDGSEVPSVVINLPGQEPIVAHYGGHPAANPTDYFWTAGWTVPEGYRTTGSLPYQVVATASDGSMGRYNNSYSILILMPNVE